MKMFNRMLVAGMLLLGCFSLAMAAKPAPPGGHLNITQVIVDNSADPTTFMISGEDLDFGSGPLVVTLGDGVVLTINSADNMLINAEFPGPMTEGECCPFCTISPHSVPLQFFGQFNILRRFGFTWPNSKNFTLKSDRIPEIFSYFPEFC